jgi:hypothetical protein
LNADLGFHFIRQRFGDGSQSMPILAAFPCLQGSVAIDAPTQMNAAICTLFEGDYHYGVGALVNSLYHHGYRGIIYAGYRGALPPWAKGAEPGDGGYDFTFAPAAHLRFIPLNVDIHFTNYKPSFMLELWRKYCPQATALFYFDPDIVINCRWSFFEEWVQGGVAVCEDINWRMPNNHPKRNKWRDHCRKLAIDLPRVLDSYHNGGFIGIEKQSAGFLLLWQTLIASIGAVGMDLRELGSNDPAASFTHFDQDCLNISLMGCKESISPVGQDGMGFQYGGGGWIMSHAAGGMKPWRKGMLLTSLLKAVPPGNADKGFYNYTQNPIRLYSWVLQRLDLLAGSAFGRYIR